MRMHPPSALLDRLTPSHGTLLHLSGTMVFQITAACALPETTKIKTMPEITKITGRPKHCLLQTAPVPYLTRQSLGTGAGSGLGSRVWTGSFKTCSSVSRV